MIYYIHNFNSENNVKIDGFYKCYNCIAYTIQEDGTITYGIAYTKERYNKKLMREAAEQALRTEPRTSNLYDLVRKTFSDILYPEKVELIPIHAFSRSYINCLITNKFSSSLFQPRMMRS